jgi:hypothetical protein
MTKERKKSLLTVGNKVQNSPEITAKENNASGCTDIAVSGHSLKLSN